MTGGRTKTGSVTGSPRVLLFRSRTGFLVRGADVGMLVRVANGPYPRTGGSASGGLLGTTGCTSTPARYQTVSSRPQRRVVRRLPPWVAWFAHGLGTQPVISRTPSAQLPPELASLIADLWQGDCPRAAPPETAAGARSTAPPPGHKAHGPQARPRSHRASHRRSAPGKACPSTTRGH